ncbi:unnamed protein product [Blepharisma stoltei]|uniref:Uncharacterized protein n=1 Tax=Blepharisma stoltei TaxID=1481888 RepID=A0AAU9KFT7_9CILI|nr:unnamed protein product [Blepharisma stoltei]
MNTRKSRFQDTSSLTNNYRKSCDICKAVPNTKWEEKETYWDLKKKNLQDKVAKLREDPNICDWRSLSPGKSKIEVDLQKLKYKIQEARNALGNKFNRATATPKDENFAKYTKSDFANSDSFNDNNELIKHIRRLEDQIYQLEEVNKTIRKSLDFANEELSRLRQGNFSKEDSEKLKIIEAQWYEDSAKKEAAEKEVLQLRKEIETMKDLNGYLEEKLKEKKESDESVLVTLKNLSNVILSKKKWNGIDSDTREKLDIFFGENMSTLVDSYEEKVNFLEMEREKFKNEVKETKDSLIGILEQLIDTDKGDLRILSQLQRNDTRDALIMLESSKDSIEERINNSRNWIRELQKEEIELEYESESPIPKRNISPVKPREDFNSYEENFKNININQLETEIQQLKLENEEMQQVIKNIKPTCEQSDFIAFVECQASAIEELLKDPEALEEWEIEF